MVGVCRHLVNELINLQSDSIK